jgi:hypothetical protein
MDVAVFVSDMPFIATTDVNINWWQPELYWKPLRCYITGICGKSLAAKLLPSFIYGTHNNCPHLQNVVKSAKCPVMLP